MAEDSAKASALWRRLPWGKAIKFILVTVLFGWFYGWASPHCFPEKQRVGFCWGMLHGALMPMALPTLVMDKDVEIFDSNNDGRFYKIGYIVGINLCGLIFFGSIFWNPAKKTFVQVEDNSSSADVKELKEE
ncbi:MAG TPA: hypothetical protein VH413_08720 [Verrucomicrobiae bacterium]|jgi:hypothetical protein|nr:hypothetical protein [Verrucomicrobiae bacterium]